jgi:hypothetical protein
MVLGQKALHYKSNVFPAQPQAKKLAEPSQNRPGQNDGLKQLLAWPSSSPGQGQATKPQLFSDIFFHILAFI